MKFMEVHGTVPWKPMEKFMEVRETSMNFQKTSMEFRGIPWKFSRMFVKSSMDVHDISVMKHFMEIFHGHP